MDFTTTSISCCSYFTLCSLLVIRYVFQAVWVSICPFISPTSVCALYGCTFARVMRVHGVHGVCMVCVERRSSYSVDAYYFPVCWWEAFRWCAFGHSACWLLRFSYWSLCFWYAYVEHDVDRSSAADRLCGAVLPYHFGAVQPHDY